MRAALLASAVTLLSGCQLYFTGDDEPTTPCGGGIGADQGWEVQYLRNPETGYCVDVGYPPPGGCDRCGNCDDILPAEPPPAWPACESTCNTLDEDTCITEPGCQVAYWEETLLQDAPAVTSFRGCYATLEYANRPSVSCWNLDAYQCAQSDTCALFYQQLAGGYGPENENAAFTRCAPEPTISGCGTVDCGEGYHCEEQCYPTSDCGFAEDCGAQCTPQCVPDTGYGCAAITCGPGYECVETCDTPTPAMGGTFPGQCDATCVPTTSCEALTDQASCDSRSDCTSVFIGDDCTCYPGGYCECAVLTWDRCETPGAVPLPL